MTTCPVHARALERPNDEAVICAEARLTWAELDARVTSLAGKLAADGIAAGDCIALQSHNSLALVLHLLALPRLGARAVMLNARLTEHETAQLVDRIRPRRFLRELTEGPTPPGPTTIHPSAGAILFTSGTTGVPKAALLRWKAFEASARASTQRLGRGRWLCTLPLFHVGGLAMLWRCMHDGSTLVLHERFDEHAFLETLARERITHASLVATTLQRVLACGVPPLPYLEAVLVGGGPTPQRLVDAARTCGLPVRLTYGLTEACSQVTTQASANGYDAGTPLDGTEVKLSPEGEILVRGPTQFLCYLFDERATKAAKPDGWLHTGDFGSLDAHGRLTVLGRRNDLLISGGENVYPAEIEATLLQHPTVRDAGVLALDDERWGQVPMALVVLRDGALDEAALREWCKTRLAAFKVPARIRPVDALPRNAMGKLDRRALAVLGGARPTAAQAPPASPPADIAGGYAPSPEMGAGRP